MSLKSYLEKNNTARQILLFTLFGQAAFLTQIVTRLILDILLKGLTRPVNIPPFPVQAAGSLIAFFASNTAAKTVSYVLNRKTTFRATTNAVKSAVIYTVMIAVLIIAETAAGTPLQNALYRLFNGPWTGSALNTASATKPGLYQICGTLSVVVCGLFDSIVIFVMDKFVIMKSDKV